ncbi:MAG: site-specific integrase [Desulfuromonadales bacterium]|nr:site-specific integrase [Desulfuromonadales bacterium]MDW7756153.1 site-specific integrase [Desulfuromonadales bacterium]
MKAGRRYKHLALLKTAKNGKPTFALLAEDQALCDFFDHWAYLLAKNNSPNTVRAYSYAVADFLNYIEEISIRFGPLTRALLREAIDSYESYLVFGEDSDAEMAAAAAKVLGSRSLSGGSVEQHFAGVNRFIEQSENLRQSLQSLVGTGFLSGPASAATALVEYGYADTPAKVQAAIKGNSWLAGCISGGYKKLAKRGLGKKAKASGVAHTNEHGGDDKTFPYDLAVATIKQAPSTREMLLWSHLCATGCRVHEALTTLIDDIIIDINDPTNNSVRIVDPEKRRNVLSRYLTEEQINMLPHKGRQTETTYMIEPFASMFWKYLDKYIQEERGKDKGKGRIVTHKFLYRKLTDGEPCVNSYQTLWERFHTVSLKVTGESYGFHSLRHMYAYYLVNFAPNPSGGFGFDLKTVGDLLGQKSLSATKRYARKDAQLLSIAIGAMNYERDRNPHFSIASARLSFLEKEVEKLKMQIEYNNAAGGKDIGQLN